MPQFSVQLLNRDGAPCTNFFGPDAPRPTKPAKWVKQVEAVDPDAAALLVILEWDSEAFFCFPVLVDVTQLDQEPSLTWRLSVARVVETRYPVTLVPRKE
jgi:hypothetical protein